MGSLAFTETEHGLYLDGVSITTLASIDVEAGNVLHCLKRSDDEFYEFGEAYFSLLNPGAVKGWKKHSRMTMNLVVPSGSIRFCLCDDREGSGTCGTYQLIDLSRTNYVRLTVPPNIWMAFGNPGKFEGVLLNIADIEHDPAEASNIPFDEIALKGERIL